MKVCQRYFLSALLIRSPAITDSLPTPNDLLPSQLHQHQHRDRHRLQHRRRRLVNPTPSTLLKRTSQRLSSSRRRNIRWAPLTCGSSWRRKLVRRNSLESRRRNTDPTLPWSVKSDRSHRQQLQLLKRLQHSRWKTNKIQNNIYQYFFKSYKNNNKVIFLTKMTKRLSWKGNQFISLVHFPARKIAFSRKHTRSSRCGTEQFLFSKIFVFTDIRKQERRTTSFKWIEVSHKHHLIRILVWFWIEYLSWER